MGMHISFVLSFKTTLLETFRLPSHLNHIVVHILVTTSFNYVTMNISVVILFKLRSYKHFIWLSHWKGIVTHILVGISFEVRLNEHFISTSV